MRKHSVAHECAPIDTDACATEAPAATPCRPGHGTTEGKDSGLTEASFAPPVAQSPAHSGTSPGHHAPRIQNRGLTTEVHPTVLQRDIWLRALNTLNRFRIIRAIDVAVACFPERPFKAALTAAQRAMRGMSKAGLVRRYRTDRHQHVYGLTTAGARWLEERNVDAAASVRRVSDMSNPEHLLWMNFVVLANEARGLRALTESELLRELNAPMKKNQAPRQGLVTVALPKGQRTLRPDAVAFEKDGLTWFEIDRSKRGADRESALSALAGRVGSMLENGQPLRRVVLFSRTDRILLRALAVLRRKASYANGQVLVPERGRHFRELEDGVFEVWAAVWKNDGKECVDERVGHVIIQQLPTWLPKVRLDASNREPLSGWFDESYLPYRRPKNARPWASPTSPLLCKHSTSSM